MLLHTAVLPNGRSFPQKISPKVVFYQILPTESVSKGCFLPDPSNTKRLQRLFSTKFFLRKGSPKFLSYRSNSTLSLRLMTIVL